MGRSLLGYVLHVAAGPVESAGPGTSWSSRDNSLGPRLLMDWVLRKQKKIAIWARFPHLPMELYHETFLRRIGSLLGIVLKIDKLTSIHSRGKFAKICVEIDLQKSLVPKIEAKGPVYCVEYEEPHLICLKCDKYGHKEVSGDGGVVGVGDDSRASTNPMMVLENGSIMLIKVDVSNPITIINDGGIKEGNVVIIQEEIATHLILVLGSLQKKKGQ
ncbi:hypothetical protein CR513_35463, partial [Mucuna pruriens]